jgi:tetratricopeptide (TPR) repeat protein
MKQNAASRFSFLFGILALGLVPLGVVAASSEPLAELFAELRTEQDAARAAQTEKEIWAEWMDSGDREINHKLATGALAMRMGRLETALRLFNEVTELDPEFAEGWNKRATALYLDGQYEPSLAAIRKTLELEPRHFGALSGRAMIYQRQGRTRGAARTYERILEIYPTQPTAREKLEELEEALASPSV